MEVQTPVRKPVPAGVLQLYESRADRPRESSVVALDERTASGSTSSPEGRFEDLFRALYGEMHALTYRLIGDRQEAEDVLQEVFLKLASADVLRRPDGEVRAWLRRVCLNTGHNRLRAGRRADHHVNRAARLALVSATDDAGPLAGVLLREQQEEVRRALDALPRNQRDCVLLRHSGYSYAEIAATLEISIGSVGVFLARGERAFRISYEDREQAL
jgi:RNA polymerase sigma factor (sigma-70 family)